MKEEEIYTLDGTVDQHGRPAARGRTGTWFAGTLILVNQGLATLAFFRVGVNLELFLTTVISQDNAEAANSASKWTGTVYIFSAFLSVRACPTIRWLLIFYLKLSRVSTPLPSLNMSDNQNKDSTVESSSPFFIHPSDHLGLLLVMKRLDGNNYATWRRSMVIALTAKNKIGFVNGTVEGPDAAKKPADYALWERCDKMVLSWLLNSVEADLADGVVYAETAQEIWDDCHDRFSQGNAPRIFQIQKSIGSHAQGSMSVSTYYTKLKALWDELASYKTQPACSCGGMKVYNEQRDQDQIMQFLMGLNDSYNPIRGQILLMNPLPSVRKAYSLITQEEKQREIGSSTTEIFSIAAAVQKYKGSNPSRFGTQNQSGDSLSSSDLHCSFCDRDRHTIKTCYKLHGYPPGHRLFRGGGSIEENHGNGQQQSAIGADAATTIRVGILPHTRFTP